MKPRKAVAIVMLMMAGVLPAKDGGKAVGTRSGNFAPSNELIDVDAFEKGAARALQDRRKRRVTENRFIEMAKDEKTIVLDTRSRSNFSLLHVKGALHLNFSEITSESLSRVIPSKDTRVLIYCNNNFDNEPKEGPPAFASKSPAMALNIPTFITLHAYGYENIYELGPLLDVRKTKIPLAGSKLISVPRPVTAAEIQN